MNWDIATAAVARAKDERDTTWHVGGPIKKFVEGAKWQRADLRTDEAVERVAESIWTTDPAPDTENETWADQDDEMKTDYRHAARAAITALLGED